MRSIPDISPEIRKLYSEIRTRPGLFLGGGHGESLTLLENYLHGMMNAFHECWVEPAHQGQGIGKKLVAELKEILQSRGIKKIYLTTLHTDATVKFYERCGFTTNPELCIMHTFL